MSRVEPVLRTRPTFWASDLAACFCFIAVVFLCCFRVSWAFRVFWANDDGCYMLRLLGWIGLPQQATCILGNHFAPGAPALWLPAGLAARAIAFVSNADPLGLTLPLISLYSLSLLGTALYFLIRWLRSAGWGSSRRFWLLAICLLLNAPILFYVTVTPFMPHSAELALAFATLGFVFDKRWYWAMGTAVVLTLTRYNDVPAILLVSAGLWQDRANVSSNTRKILVSVAAIAIAGVLSVAFVSGYGPVRLQDLLANGISGSDLAEFLIGSRWGMLWMCPWWCVAFALGSTYLRKLSWVGRAAWVWMASEALLCVIWKGNGGSFGYRYLIGSYAAATWVWIEGFAVARPLHYLRIGLETITVIGAAWMTVLTCFFDSTPPFLPETWKDSLGRSMVAGVPDFGLKTLLHLATPRIYGALLKHQNPLAALWISFYGADDPSNRGFVWDGLPLLVLTFSVLFALIYVAIFSLRRRRSMAERAALFDR